jgi:hypothetical protein
LSADLLERAAGRWLEAGEINALIARRDAILAHFERLVAARGEAAVFVP